MNEMPTVKLRALEPEDLDTLYRIENDNDLWNVGRDHVPYCALACTSISLRPPETSMSTSKCD
jgi:hypothetical protein